MTGFECLTCPRADAHRAESRYDTRGAKEAGIKTVYVYRWTDDINEDQAAVRRENDAYLEEGMAGVAEAVARLGSS